jgi:ABC-type amino acid transport substrate-binding protein
MIAGRLYPEQITKPRGMFQEIANAVAVPKGKLPAFLARLSLGLDAIRADNTWQEINKRWIGQ